ncbi:MAG: TolC family protein, partial [Gammaproteobacteria bacterium]|nr:TolC family protein [Gammaproteobacteria bacterium]
KLYDAGLNQSQTQIARLNWLANQQALTANQRTNKQALSNVLYNLRNNKQQIQLQENLLATAITSLAATHKEYELGVTDLVAVLEAEQNVATNEVDLIQARYDQIIYQSDLKRLTGRLKQGDLQQYDALLN